jgi:hypothetical protein
LVVKRYDAVIDNSGKTNLHLRRYSFAFCLGKARGENEVTDKRTYSTISFFPGGKERRRVAGKN